MILFQVALQWLVFSILSVTRSPSAVKATSLYNSIDPVTFSLYSSIWNFNHQSWVSIDHNEQYCDASLSWTVYPVCSGEYTIEEDYLFNSQDSVQCRRAQCIRLQDGCGITPRDTVDYLPPSPTTSLDTDSICPTNVFDQLVSNYSYGLDQGIPPEFTPISPIGLQISGYVYARYNGICRPVPNAEIIAWHIDSQQLSALQSVDRRNYWSNATKNNGDTKGPYSNIDSSQIDSLRSHSCRGQQHTDAQGKYTFQTILPSSYGPPRHIMFTISAPGFQTITTRVYFDKDWRLHQLTTDHGNVNVRTAESPPQAHGFSIDHEDYSTTAIYPGKIAKDPRVAKLKFRHVSIPANLGAGTVPTGLAYGHFEVDHSFYLAPLRSTSKDGDSQAVVRDESDIPPFDIRGLWSDTNGGMVSVETYGNIFIAHEVPHPRTWHVLWGYLVGNTIRGVQFQNSLSTNVQTAPLQDITMISTERIQVTGFTTGVIIPTDPFQSNAFTSTNPQAMTIEWSGGDILEPNLLWSKQSDRIEDTGGRRYRYMKLLILRTHGLSTQRLHEKDQVDPGQVVINEIEFYESILANEERPHNGQKLKSARFPAPFVVTCSTFLTQDHHCYKAFDGDTSSKSSWITQSVGFRRNVLAEPQWVLFDFGEGHAIHPTALRIVCDAANTEIESGLDPYQVKDKGPSGCPMTFMLQGSNDNTKFDTLYRADLYDYARNGSFLAEYPRQGRMFYFVYDSLHGRGNGQRCGSCDTAPSFTCNRDSFDATCDSRYCGTDAKCAALPTCPPGEFLHVFMPETKTSLYASQVFRCEKCPAGRYGQQSGLTSIVCSGVCAPGYYCPAASISPTQFPCSEIDRLRPYAYYCPLGSGSPLLTPSGQRTVLEPAQDRVVSCEPGAYCQQGIQYPCPVGRYGARGSLMTSDCTTHCPVGYYCSQTTDNPWINLQENRSDVVFLSRENYLGVGNVNPVVCPKGHYCPDGRYAIPCPAGTYGNITGLRDEYCAGPCALGHYCPRGSVSATEIPCPGGTFGHRSGLKNAQCAGLCPEGYYCPVGTASGYTNPCGGPNVYCPEGSAYPTSVTPGFYTAPGIGGVNYRNQTHQRPAELGFYAQYGRRFACPAGTFGNISGLNADQPFQGLTAPTAMPTPRPSPRPTCQPSMQPSRAPTIAITAVPTLTRAPTSPTHVPTDAPTADPTWEPTYAPSQHPTYAPSVMPTQPTYAPSCHPSQVPTSLPTSQPSRTYRPSAAPSYVPTAVPTLILVRRIVTAFPSFAPTSPSEAVLTKFLCSGYCAPGYYCPENSTSSQQVPCPAGRYGNRPGLADFYCTDVCPLGHYCPSGSVEPTPCPAGVFGNSLGLTDATCSSVCPTDVTGQEFQASTDGSALLSCDVNHSRCPAGYYCPIGTIAAQQYACGNANVYCPAGSGRPIPVSEGYYTLNDDLQRHLVRLPMDVLHNQTRIDRAKATINETNYLEVTRVTQTICEPGSFCVGGKRYLCPPGRYGDRAGLSDASCAGICARGYYCPQGSTSMRQFACPAGRYGADLGMTDSACSGLCAAGYHCPPASTSPTQLLCGIHSKQFLDAPSFTRWNQTHGHQRSIPADPFRTRQQDYYTEYNLTVHTQLLTFQTLEPDSYALLLHPGGISADSPADAITRVEVAYHISTPNSVFCPEGSARPIPIMPGYYSAGGTSATTRTNQVLCPIGAYCDVDGIRRACPAGRYGYLSGLSSPSCSGPCQRGYYCPAGSVTSAQIQCPIGRYGDREGLASAECSGPCLHPLDCPAGSITSKPGRNV